jgi:5-methylthioribose kinase
MTAARPCYTFFSNTVEQQTRTIPAYLLSKLMLKSSSHNRGYSRGGGFMKFIFEVHLHDGYTAEQYADAWIRASEIIQQAPGAAGTRLHRKIGEPGVLLAIATWQSKQARDAMEARPIEQVQKIISEQSKYCDIRVIGEFTDAEWQVDPPAA